MEERREGSRERREGRGRGGRGGREEGEKGEEGEGGKREREGGGEGGKRGYLLSSRINEASLSKFVHPRVVHPVPKKIGVREGN
jgi:hypothetical protein